eukprot:m.124842 g.124842  ORF g.124842 m.124842 type:complete len:173 (+) comp37858_c1_seq1:699-1217(+)
MCLLLGDSLTFDLSTAMKRGSKSACLSFSGCLIVVLLLAQIAEEAYFLFWDTTVCHYPYYGAAFALPILSLVLFICGEWFEERTDERVCRSNGCCVISFGIVITNLVLNCLSVFKCLKCTDSGTPGKDATEFDGSSMMIAFLVVFGFFTASLQLWHKIQRQKGVSCDCDYDC